MKRLQGGSEGHWGTGGRGGGVTPAPLSKKGASEGEAEAAIPALGWYHVKLSASSLFLLRGFVSHANSSSGPNSSGQALHPNWHRLEKKGGRGLELEEYMGIEGGERSGHVQNTSSFSPLMSCLCPPWESSEGTKAPLFSSPSTVSFSRMNESFRSCTHCVP